MAGEISLTPEQLRTRAKQYKAQSDALAKSIKTMDSLIKSLQAEWKGDASRAYAERYSKLKPSFNNAKELMDELEANLKATAKIMEETDKKIASQLK